MPGRNRGIAPTAVSPPLWAPHRALLGARSGIINDVFSFSPHPDDYPLAAWSWQTDCADLTPADACPSRAVAMLKDAGYGGLTVPIGGGAPTADLGRTAQLVEACARVGLAVWLRPTEPLRALCGSLQVDIHNIGAAEARDWRAPEQGGQLLAVDAIPLQGALGAPDWNACRSLGQLGPAPATGTLAVDIAEMADLASAGAGIRVYTWSASSPRPDDLMYGDWPAAAVALLAQLSPGADRGAVRGVVVDALAPAGRPGAGALPWLSDLPATFFTLHGYALIDRLTSLVAPVGGDAVVVRMHYWSALGAALEELYRQPLQRFCRNHDLTLRTALSAPASAPASTPAPNGQANSGAPAAARLLVASLDDATTVVRLVEPANAPLGKRALAGITELGGAAPLLARTWEGQGWAATPAAGAPHFHRLAGEGMSWLETAVARPLAANAPSLTRQPYAVQMARFNQRLSNLRCALRGAPGARVGLLWPQRSIQAHYNPRGHRYVRWVEEDLRATASLLDELHFDFLFVEELHIEAAAISCEKGLCSLVCGTALQKLAMIVLPSVTALSWAAWRKLDEFVAAGGCVVCLGLLPRWSERGRDADFEEHVGKATMMVVADLYEAYAAAEGAEVDNDQALAIGYPVVRSQVSGGRMGCYQPRLNSDADDARLRVHQMLTECLVPELETQAPSVKLTRRLAPGGEMVMVFNGAARAQRVNLQLRPQREAVPHLCDPQRAAVTPFHQWMQLGSDDGHGLALALEMRSLEVVLLYLAYGQAAAHAERANFTIESFEDDRIKGYATATGRPLASVRAAGARRLTGWLGEGVVVPPPLPIGGVWNALRAGPNALRLHAVGSGAGGASNYQLSVAAAIETLWLRVPFCRACCEFDGVPLAGSAAAPYEQAPWNQTYGTIWFALPGAVGEHRLTVWPELPLTAAVVADPALIELLVLGDFSLDERGAVTAPASLELEEGSWHDQGLPYYSGELAMTTCCEVPAGWSGCRSFLELHGLRDLVEAQVNEQRVGLCAAPPYRYDTSFALRPGELNDITLRFWNSADAALGKWEGAVAPSGLIGPARLVAYPLLEIVRSS